MGGLLRVTAYSCLVMPYASLPVPGVSGGYNTVHIQLAMQVPDVGLHLLGRRGTFFLSFILTLISCQALHPQGCGPLERKPLAQYELAATLYARV